MRAGSRGIARAYAALYDLEARLAESAYDVAAEAARDAEFRRARVVLFDVARGPRRRGAAAGTPCASLRRQHRPLLVHLEDPDIARLARELPETAGGGVREGVGARDPARQSAPRARLRHAGIETVSTSADRLTLDTLDLYLPRCAGGAPPTDGARQDRAAPRPLPSFRRFG